MKKNNKNGSKKNDMADDGFLIRKYSRRHPINNEDAETIMNMKLPIKRIEIAGSRRPTVFFSTSFLLLSGLGFLLAGISSCIKRNLVSFGNPSEINFLPQGFVMTFYGALAIGFGLFFLYNLIFDIGRGSNEFNFITRTVTIIRKGFPGKNREILLSYSFDSIRFIGILVTEGFNANQSLFLCLKDGREIPLNQVNEPNSLLTLEEEGAELAKLLRIPLANLY